MGCNIRPTAIDDIVEGNYYQILNTDTLLRFKGLPFLVSSVHMPFILTNIGILDLREHDFIKTSKEFLSVWNKESSNFNIPYSNSNEMCIGPFST